MKTSTYKYIFLIGFAGAVVACSTKKDTFTSRNYHALTTKDNVLYNGNIALNAGINDLKTTYNDNFWDVLTVERMQPTKEEMEPTDKPNANFERAETKATKAIQKHSMYIGGTEHNPQMDEAHLLLGKARYYDNRFIPALEAFNYILYKYPTSDKIDEAKVWREKTNIRLDNDEVAIKNLKQLLKEKGASMDDQVYSDANAMLAQAYIKTEQPDSALSALRRAVKVSKDNEKKARYRFIEGQLYDKTGQPDSAYAAYQAVIDMKRKSPRRYVIEAHAMQASQFDYKNGDTLAFMEKYKKLLKDRENRPFLDVLNYQVGLFYDKQELNDNAVKYYNKALRATSKDKYLRASGYRNIAEINFEEAHYETAGKYYDSTLVYLEPRSREYYRIKRKRDNLSDVIKYEGIARTNDSILYVTSLSKSGQVSYYEDYIEKLKKQDEMEKERMEKEARKQQNMAGGTGALNSGLPTLPDNANGNTQGALTNQRSGGAANQFGGRQRVVPPSANQGSTPPVSPVSSTQAAGQGGKFYFYTFSTVAFGKQEFQRNWGKRPYVDNWRWSSELKNIKGSDTEALASEDSIPADKQDAVNPRYNTDFYISQLPTSQTVLDSLAKDRNFAYYQLGIIYEEKFKEYQKAADKLEKLLVNNPEERLILPAKYNLYKIYQVIDPAKAEDYKNQILNEYPDSRYAEIIRNPNAESGDKQSPEAVYSALYKRFEDGELRTLLPDVEERINLYTGEDIVSKFELLKADITGRLEGVDAYKTALNFVALNYPNSEEGKKAEDMLKTNIPVLEKAQFGDPAISWNIIFKFEPGDPKIKTLTDKIKKFIQEGLNNNITLTEDVYTQGEDFVVIHGFSSRLSAEDAASVLKEYKDYKIPETPVIISNEDYRVIQIKKNFTEFLALK